MCPATTTNRTQKKSLHYNNSGPRPLSVSIDEAARLIGVSRSSVYRRIKEGRLRKVKCGTRTLVPMASLDAFLAAAPAVQPRFDPDEPPP